jgi:ubiquitin-activating enzyme E1
MTEINQYDRQNRTFGIEATKLIQSSSIYIIGLKNGYASEICKNLALSGIKTLILFGDEIIDEKDIKNCMFYRNSQIGSFCWEEIKKHINEINNSVHIEHVQHVHDIKLSNATCVIINKPFNEAFVINRQVRLLNGKTIYMVAGGLAGSIFVDANVNHQVFDTTGEIKEDVPIKDIIINNNNNKNNLRLVCGKHNFNYGDKVKFINMVGENLEYYNTNIFIVVNTNNNSIEIVEEDYKLIQPNEINRIKFINGSIKYVETKKCFHHFEIDYSQSSEIYKNLNEMLINNQCQSQFINKCFKYTFIPIISVMGGLVSTEVIKLVTNKYTPISQWYEWSDFDVIKDYDNIDEEINNINTALINNNILMVGCGALGCEWLKNLALMGSQNITIIDPDHIERSNLSRQFLFRNSHIGKSKCLTAIETINNMINATATTNYNGIVQKLTSQDIKLTNELFKNKNIIISALDNIEARRYVDTLCFEKCLPMFESGTMGMKCNTQPVIPFITETYSNTNDADDGENQFPVCTIKNFPNSIHHTIHWARDYFELFNRGPTNCNKYIDTVCFLDTLSPFDKTQAIEDINYFLSDVPQNYNDCVMKAKKMFEELYIINILQLLKKFPEDHEIDGKLFWSHGKLCPKPLDFNSNLHSNIGIDFIINTANIFSKIYGISINYDFDTNIITKFKNDYHNIEEVEIAKTDEEQKQLSSVIKEVELKENISKVLLNPQEFEKDEPENVCDYKYHVDWVSAASNCRATNYGINTISTYETKGIAGKIIPAVATTTSTAVGLIALELLKYLNGIDKIDKYRSWYMNMADNTIIYSEPNPISDIVINNKKINGWTKFKYSKNTTLKEFIKYYNELFNVEIEMILYETAIIYAEFMNNYLETKLSELFLNEFNIDIF